MAEPTKDELLREAQQIGVEGADDMTKAELADAIAARNPDSLGPVVPEGQTAPEPAESDGRAITGVQPVEAEDIPEAAR